MKDCLSYIRAELTNTLWKVYLDQVKEPSLIVNYLEKHFKEKVILDHYAIIDLPGPNSGLNILSLLFSAIGYRVQGREYLPEKQNEFIWMAEGDALDKPVKEALPQVVIADFRLSELPGSIKRIITKYTQKIQNICLAEIQNLSGQAYLGDIKAAHRLLDALVRYFTIKDRPLPTVREYEETLEFNELLAWVLVFGRQPNHFTVSIHHLESFNSLSAFNTWVTQELSLQLSDIGGIIKGKAELGLEQSATRGNLINVKLADGFVTMPEPFIEFVWRYPRSKNSKNLNWGDYYTGFMPNNATRIIESVYKF